MRHGYEERLANMTDAELTALQAAIMVEARDGMAALTRILNPAGKRGRRMGRKDGDLRADCERLAAQGLTQTEAAQSLGVVVSAVNHCAKKFGIRFVGQQKSTIAGGEVSQKDWTT